MFAQNKRCPGIYGKCSKLMPYWDNHKICRACTQGIKESANFRFLQRLSIIFGLRVDCLRSLASCRDYHPWKMASCRDCPCDSASCWDTWQEAKSHGQSLQEGVNQVQQPRQEARDHGQSWRKPNMTDSLCRKRKLADSFIPCAVRAITVPLLLPVKFVQSGLRNFGRNSLNHKV